MKPVRAITQTHGQLMIDKYSIRENKMTVDCVRSHTVKIIFLPIGYSYITHHLCEISSHCRSRLAIPYIPNAPYTFKWHNQSCSLVFFQNKSYYLQWGSDVILFDHCCRLWYWGRRGALIHIGQVSVPSDWNQIGYSQTIIKGNNIEIDELNCWP